MLLAEGLGACFGDGLIVQINSRNSDRADTLLFVMDGDATRDSQQVRHHQEACIFLHARGEGCAGSTAQRRRPRLEGGQLYRVDAIMIGPFYTSVTRHKL